MKKGLVLIVLFVMSGFYLFTFVSRANAVSTADQYCTNSNLESYESIHRNDTDYRQAFIPTQNRVNSISVKVGGNGVTGVAILRVFTSPSDTSNYLLSSTRNFSNINEPQIWYFNDFGDVELTPGTTYYIRLSSSVDYLYWYTVSSGGCDAPGMAYLNGTQMGYKLDFATFGFTYTAPPANENTNSANSNTNTNANTNANTNTNSTPAGQSAGSGDAPAATTSTTIKAPSGLTVVYSEGGAVLNWTKSTTTDIDGYKIFRSETSTKGFVEIGKTVKATLEYVDTKDLTVGKTYYYFVRAYKTTTQSASTTTVALLIPEATATTNENSNTNRSITPVSASVIDNTDYAEIQLYWILGGVISVLIVLLVAYEKEKIRKGDFVGARHFKLIK